MPKLAISDEFFEEYERLEKRVRTAVRNAASTFQKLTPAQLHAGKGLHLEKLEGARDPRIRTIRITKSYRGVVLAPDDGSDIFLLLRVAPHDEAISWACKRMYSVNTATGCVEVRNVDALETMEPFFQEKAGAEASRLFANHSDGVLRDLGLDEQMLGLARLCNDRDDLLIMVPPVMPRDQYEVLDHLSVGFSPEEVWEQLVVTRRPDARPAGEREPVGLDEAIRNTSNHIVEVAGPDELERVLSGDFARWRIFLHPSQRRVAYHPGYAGSAQVTGGPGTGKTVAALHRVRHLLRRDRDGDGRILLTTFTNAMADALRDNLKLLLGDTDASLLSRVDVTTVDSLAFRVLREARGRAPKPLSGTGEKSVWAKIRAQHSLTWPEQFLSQELRHVVLAQNIHSAAEYQQCVRRGRGTKVDPAQRPQLWEAVQEFSATVAGRGQATYPQLCAQAADILQAQDPRYSHVVVDEAQDLHPTQWRVLRACVAPGPDDIFLVGDPHQRIYDARVSLKSLGIPVVGRTSRLRLNYRSTEEILNWSLSLLHGQHIQQLGADGDDGPADSLADYRSELHGRPPTAHGWQTQQEELAALVSQVRSWITEDGVQPAHIGVCARFNSIVDAAIAQLKREGVPAVAVKDSPGSDVDGVRVATMHAMKGLEFRCVALVGVNADVLPFPRQVTPEKVDPVQHRTDLLAEHCLLFVACTRARDALAVSWHGQHSPLLEPVVNNAAGQGRS